MNKTMINTMKEKLKYEAPALTTVEFRTEMGFAQSMLTFNMDQVITESMDLGYLGDNEFNAGQFTNVDQSEPSGAWVYSGDGSSWF